MVSDIALDEMEQKYITVKLMGSSGIDHPHESDIRIWPVPAGDHLFISTDRFIGNKIKIRISNQSGMPVYDIEDVFIDEDQLVIDISHLPPGFYIISLFDTTGRNYNRSFIRY